MRQGALGGFPPRAGVHYTTELATTRNPLAGMDVTGVGVYVAISPLPRRAHFRLPDQARCKIEEPTSPPGRGHYRIAPPTRLTFCGKHSFLL